MGLYIDNVHVWTLSTHIYTHIHIYKILWLVDKKLPQEFNKPTFCILNVEIHICAEQYKLHTYLCYILEINM